MNTESIGPYSPTTIYGQLTSPFTPKLVTINAHTPYDKVDEEEQSQVFSRDFFEGRPQAKMIYELPDKEYLAMGISEYRSNSGSDSDEDTSSKPIELSSFVASQASSKDIVQNSLKRGYSTEEAIAMKEAQNAYKNSATLTKDPIGALSTRSYRVF